MQLTYEPVEFRRDAYVVSTDRARLDVDVAHRFLMSSYWARGMAREVLEQAIAGSLTFGMYRGDEMVGLGRAITDGATYAYLSDVFVAEAHRGRGLGVWLVECMLAHPQLQRLRRIALFTRDARGLYEKFGFGPVTTTSTYLEIRNPAR